MILFIIISLFFYSINSLTFNSEIKLLNETIKLTKNDLIQCEIEQLIELPKNTNNYDVLKTNRSNIFTFYPIKLEEKCLRFSVRAPNEITISITDSDKMEMFEFFLRLGQLDTSESKIRRISAMKNVQDSPLYLTPGILSDEYFHEFWITWYDNKVKLGRDGDPSDTPLMYFNETEMFEVKYIGIRSSRSSGQWIFKESICPQIEHTEGKTSLIKKEQSLKSACFKTARTSVNAIPEIRFQKHLLDQIASDLQYFKSNRHQRTKTYLQKYLNDLEETYVKSKNFHDKILLNTKIDENQLNEYLEMKIFNDIRLKYFEFYQYVEDELNKVSDFEKFEYHEYLYNPSVSNGCFYFNITNINDIRVQLKNEQNTKIEIFIGNKNSSITALCTEHNHTLGIAMAETKNLLLSEIDLTHNFWIKWAEEGLISVGKLNQTSFLSYKISDMSPITSVQLRTIKTSITSVNTIENCS